MDTDTTRTVTIKVTFGDLAGNADEAVARYVESLAETGIKGADDAGYYQARVVTAEILR